jgi:hypothetical protein
VPIGQPLKTIVVVTADVNTKVGSSALKKNRREKIPTSCCSASVIIVGYRRGGRTRVRCSGPRRQFSFGHCFGRFPRGPLSWPHLRQCTHSS